jgi:putative aldouronate transport system substrate-binding protein
MCLCVVSALLSGCGNGGLKEQGNGAEPTLTYWVELYASSTDVNFGDTPFANALEKETGIQVKYIHPTAGQVDEQFNIMLASNELPDIIERNWYHLPGGPQKAIDDNYIISLNDVIGNHAPNLKALLASWTELDKMVKTDSNNYYVFPFVRGDDMLKTYAGLMLRKDWLDELGLSVPETIDEWYEALTAFKEKKNAAAPFSFLENTNNMTAAISGAYGVKKDFFVENGTVKFGPVEEGYRDYLTTMNKWYNEKLLDNNFAAIDSKTLEANILSGRTGACIGTTGGNLGKWIAPGKENDPGFDLVAAFYPTLNKGDMPRFKQMDWTYSVAGAAAITTACKDVKLAAKLLDYGYSEAGRKLCNYGIEGESYNMIDGYPTYTDLITQNPEGLSMSSILARYARAGSGGPFVQEKEYMEQYSALPQQRDALNKWVKADAAQYLMPPVSFQSEESGQMANIMSEVNTYIDEMFIKFVIGTEPIEKFDQYVQQVKKLKIDRAIAIQQDALDRYNKR